MPNINEIGLLASFNKHGSAGSVKDNERGKELDESRRTSIGLHRVSKSLFPESDCCTPECGGEVNPKGENKGVNAYTKINSFIGKARTLHYKLTFEYEDGWQLLPLAGHAGHDEHLLLAESQLQNVYKPALRSAYPALVDGARVAHNGDFKPQLYPPIDEFLARFAISHSYKPAPSGESLASSIVSARMQGFRDTIEANNARIVQAAISETWARLLEPVVDLAQRLADPNTRRLAGIVSNVREIAARIPLLNLTGDSNLAQAGERITAILETVDSESLNTNAALRAETANTLQSIASQFGNLGGNRRIAA